MSIKSSFWYFIHVIFPVFCGGALYIAYRPTNLKMFGWFSLFGLDSSISISRDALSPLQIPEWLIYSLPDGLWTYALTCGMITIWSKRINKKNAIWIFAGPIIAMLLEIGQFLGFVKGTFDEIDLAFVLTASLLALTHVNYDNQQKPQYESTQ